VKYLHLLIPEYNKLTIVRRNYLGRHHRRQKTSQVNVSRILLWVSFLLTLALRLMGDKSFSIGELLDPEKKVGLDFYCGAIVARLFTVRDFYHGVYHFLLW